MNIETIQRYWEEACNLTVDLQPDKVFSTLELVEYLNRHLLSADSEQMTKTKVNYLRSQEILKPMESGEGAIRTSWRYSVDDARRALMIELLKIREDLSVQESKGWLRSFEEAQCREVQITEAYRAATQEKPAPADPVSLVYTLLRSRTLGTLISALSRGEADVTPPECLIAIRTLDRITETLRPRTLASWEEVRQLLKMGSWHMAASDPYLKLHVYPTLEQLQNSLPEVVDVPVQHRWYSVIMRDGADRFYEVVLGLPKRDVLQPAIEAIDSTITEQIKTESILNVNSFPGLATLLKSAFVNQPMIEEGPALSILTKIIATASDAWDYCAILLPERSKDGKEKWLHVQERSSESLYHLKDKRIEVGQFLSGWCYRYRQSVVVESTVANDPRIAFYEEERPFAAAAVPAIAGGQQVVGVIYVAKSQQRENERSFFSKEAEASLKAFGYICGDMIARAEIEIETVRSMTRLCTHPLITSFSNLEELLQRVVDEVQGGKSTENLPLSWIYFLILNIQVQSQDHVIEWLCQQAIELAGNFLANRLWDPLHRDPPSIGLCKVESDQYVFAILNAVDLSEARYKQGIAALQQDMDQMRIGRLPPGFYPSAITFRYEDLREQFKGKGREGLMAYLMERIWGALKAGPYIKRGHEALRKRDLDLAVAEFEDALRALRYAPNSWYVYKHLAEARMLQGTEQAIEQAIKMCREALKLNAGYASAHCVLADCLSYQGEFDEALIEYERALTLDGTRSDFLIRYGIALASMTTSEYQEVLNKLRQREPELARQHTYLDEPWQEAIDKFDRAQKLSAMFNETFEVQQERSANYRYQRGYAHLQAGLIDKAVEDFAVCRKLVPDNLQLAQAYSYALRLRRREESENKSRVTRQSEIEELDA